MLFPANRNDLVSKYVTNKQFYGYMDKSSHIVISVPYMVDALTEALYPNYRFCTDTNVWYHFNGQQFLEFNAMPDTIQKSFNQYKTLLEHIHDSLTKRFDETFLEVVGLAKLHNAKFAEQVISRLRGKSQLQITLDQFDTVDHLLNTPGGIIDLHNSNPNINSALNLCKNITEIGPLDDEDGTKCTNYLNHLKFMSDGDSEIVTYLEQLSGYILTGDIGLQKFFWWCGLKNNGKSTLAKLWMYILKDYACTGGSSQFAKRYHEPHSEEDIRLKDKRFVYIDELTDGKFNQEKIKRWADGGAVRAAEKGGRTIEFIPKCKILFTSNTKPSISGADGGFERRLDLTPFIAQVPSEVRKLNYDVAVLRSEAPYILNRMIKQAKRYYETQSIIRPRKTMEESAAYIQQNDVVGEFVKNSFEVNKEFNVTAKDAYEACQIFCNENNYEMMTPQKLGRELAQLGFKQSRENKIRTWAGLKLNKYYTDKIRVGYG